MGSISVDLHPHDHRPSPGERACEHPDMQTGLRSGGQSSTWEPDYRQLIESAGDAIYTLDLDGCFTFVNAALLRTLGHAEDDAEALLGRHFAEILTPDAAAVATQHFAEGVDGAAVTPFFEVEAVRTDGSVISLEVRAGDLVQDGVRVGRQGIARDISELKRLHGTVAEKSERLALIEEHARLAFDLYRRIAHLTLAPPAGPLDADSALEGLRRSVRVAAATDAGMSATDLRILQLLAGGLSNRGISLEVHLSPHTVKDHVSKLMRLLDCRARTELAAEAARRGLI
jgi:PAS domain S-box-containing protein